MSPASDLAFSRLYLSQNPSDFGKKTKKTSSHRSHAHRYLDPLCPFCAKISTSLTTNVLPLLEKGGEYDGQLSLTARLYAQPLYVPFTDEDLLL